MRKRLIVLQRKALMPQAPVEYRNLRRGAHLGADTEVLGLVRRPRSRVDHDVVDLLECANAPALPVIGHDDGRSAKDLGEVVVEVLGERFIILDEQGANRLDADVSGASATE